MEMSLNQYEERVIFRREKNTFGTDGICVLACYPDDDAWTGRIAATPMRMTNSGRTFFEAYTEVSNSYYYGDTKPIKDKSLLEKCRMELERFFNGDIRFKVCSRR